MSRMTGITNGKGRPYRYCVDKINNKVYNNHKYAKRITYTGNKVKACIRCTHIPNSAQHVLPFSKWA